LVTWRATRAYLQSDLYRLGITADGSGPYALDIKLIQFWSSLSALAQIPIPLRYRLTEGLTPRNHWCFRLTDKDPDGTWMLANGVIALGPARVGNLAGVFSLSRKTEVRRSIELAFQDAGIVAGSRCLQDLLNLGYGLKEGDLVALLDNAGTVRAVGKVTAGYCHAFNAERPHRVPIRWLHQRRFDFSAPINRGMGNLFGLSPEDPAVAVIEASLLLNGSGEWPDFMATSGLRETHQTGMVPQSLEPPQDRIAGQLIRMLERKKQVILYGPPGTGKTYYAEQTALEMVARHNFHCLPRQLSTGQTDRIWGREEGHFPFIALCTFHPLYAYEDFIEGYRPEREGFSLRPGLFRRMATAAQAQPDKRFVLIVDEINRGNIPKIFGELITLLEPAKRGVIQVQLPLSGERFSVPDNLYLIATMNTADHSILLLDVALRRRFGFRELRPDPHLLQQSRIGDLPLAIWLQVLNQRIVHCLRQEGRNLQVGHAYFMPRGEPVTDIRRIAEIVRENIWPLLQEYCYDDPQALATILAADEGGIYDCETADLRHELFEPGREKELIQALQNMVGPKYRRRVTDTYDAGPEAVDAVISSEIQG
jgi:5-methylcytosine-specific restriction protein B